MENKEIQEYNSIFEIFNISKLKWTRFTIIAIFLLSIFTSTLSILGGIGLFYTLHNSLGLAIAAAVCFEIGQILALVAYGTLARQNKTLILSIIIFLTTIQVSANINTSWFIINSGESITFLHKTVINGLISIVDFFNYNSTWAIKEWANRAVVFFITGSLPVISLMYVKSLLNYFSFQQPTTPVKELKQDTKVEQTDDFLFADSENKKVVKPLFGDPNKQESTAEIIEKPIKKKVKQSTKPLINNDIPTAKDLSSNINKQEVIKVIDNKPKNEIVEEIINETINQINLDEYLIPSNETIEQENKETTDQLLTEIQEQQVEEIQQIEEVKEEPIEEIQIIEPIQEEQLEEEIVDEIVEDETETNPQLIIEPVLDEEDEIIIDEDLPLSDILKETTQERPARARIRIIESEDKSRIIEEDKHKISPVF